ncbi:DUF3060 domain-containing protein [Mycolicibacterium phlei]|jgi:hypothetical protein|uniref:DUF3060 domain-containing protein n=1 Tax=Mycolicibacterium phlei TaxID=1771 RepID=UPI0005904D25|nr:DUF3060 domain-containing protein [Mycolicibacterium phlei]
MLWTLTRSVAAATLALPLAAAPAAVAEPEICNPYARQCADNGIVGGHDAADTHITGIGVVDTIDCKNATLLINGANNRITALGTCWAVTMQGNGNVVIADNVVNDITVYGWDQQVLYKNGSPAILDRGRELGMTNSISRVPA